MTALADEHLVQANQSFYQRFLAFVRQSADRERRAVNRRLFSVLLWCFLLPTAVLILFLLLIEFDFISWRYRGYADWVLLIFPVVYSLYFLSSEVLRDVPSAFRRGPVASVLAQAERDGRWRDEICRELDEKFGGDVEQWRWISQSFSKDLNNLKYRARYLTALAGAVFYLLMQGLDFVGGEPVDHQPVKWIKDPNFGWVELSSQDFTSFIGLGLFLVLLYLSAIQTYQSLKKYLDCAELMMVRSEQRGRAKL